MEFVTTLALNCLCDGWERKKSFQQFWRWLGAIFISFGPLLIIIKHVGNKLNVHVVVILFFQGFRLCHRPIFKEKIFLFFFLLATKFRSLHTISIYSIDAPWLVHGQTGWTASFTIKTET